MIYLFLFLALVATVALVAIARLFWEVSIDIDTGRKSLAVLWDIFRSLDAIGRALESGRLQGPQGEQGIAGPPGAPLPVEHPVLTASGVRRDLVEVLRANGKHWVHAAWVEIDSSMYRHYAADPTNFRLRHHGEE